MNPLRELRRAIDLNQDEFASLLNVPFRPFRRTRPPHEQHALITQGATDEAGEWRISGAFVEG